MSFFANLRAERLIETIREAEDIAEPGVQKALAKLAKLGPSVIPSIVEVLPSASRKETMAYVDVLGRLVDNKSLPALLEGLTDGDPKTTAAICWALSTSRSYNPNLLLDLLARDDMPKSAILDVLTAQKKRLNPRELLKHAYNQEQNEKTALFRIVSELADENTLPELVSRVEGKDPLARMHIINILARFNRPEVVQAIQTQLRDPNKLIRHAALDAISQMDGQTDIATLCELLRDADLDVQAKAVDAVVRARHPDTMKYLINVLRDENEYARRAAVEVLNSIGTSKDIKELLQAIRDDDWWVRTRAADALGKIGGPRVVDAVLELIRDKDDDVRRAAIEILNQTRDERAVDSLIQATRDPDWWVAERAVDALAEIGSPKAVPGLLKLLQIGSPKSLPTLVRALGKLGDSTIVDALLLMLKRPEKDVCLEAIAALTRLTDERHADTVRAQIQAVNATATDEAVANAALRALDDLDARFYAAGTAAQQLAERMTEPSRTLLVEKADLEEIVRQAEVAAKLDISTLRSGDVIEGRYKFIEKIGKGAFGTVLLVEDTVVEERLILKFLNPNVSQDEEMMKRFVHELRYSRKITHRNVIRIYDFLFIRGNYAISMEYFPSHTLGAEIVNEQPMPLKRALSYGIDIATGMAVAHQAGIVHRDLKPANILINDESLLKIVDFGVAAAQKEGDTQLTKTGYVIGSPKYMAPEQILGKKVDERADVYSLGVILYEMLTGRPPYSRGDHMSVMYQHVQGRARAAIDVNPALAKPLSDLVMKAMAVDKLKRFQTMDELRLALEKLL